MLALNIDGKILIPFNLELDPVRSGMHFDNEFWVCDSSGILFSDTKSPDSPGEASGSALRYFGNERRNKARSDLGSLRLIRW